MQFAAEHIGSYYGAFASDYRVLVEANLRCAEKFGIDQLNTMSDPYRETAGFGAPIEFPRNGVPICLKPPLEENPDLMKLPRPNPLQAPRMRDRIEAVATAIRRCYAEAGEPFMVNAGCEIPAPTPPQNLSALCQLIAPFSARGEGNDPGDRPRPADQNWGSISVHCFYATSPKIFSVSYYDRGRSCRWNARRRIPGNRCPKCTTALANGGVPRRKRPDCRQQL
jgi:uroporphyrinogen-III decarboxylase